MNYFFGYKDESFSTLNIQNFKIDLYLKLKLNFGALLLMEKYDIHREEVQEDTFFFI